MKSNTIVFLGVFLLSAEACSQPITGKYSLCDRTDQERKAQLQSYLELFDNGTFEYTIYGDIGPLKVGNGTWKLMNSKIQFSLRRRKPDSLRIVGITMKSVNKADNKRRIELYEVGEDTIRMVGTFLVAGKDTIVLGIKEPMEIPMNVQDVKFTLLREKVEFHFSESEKFNHYIFYLTGQRDQYSELDSMPFSELTFDVGRLSLSSSSGYCFKKKN